jgi:hypothetical protein
VETGFATVRVTKASNAARANRRVLRKRMVVRLSSRKEFEDELRLQSDQGRVRAIR